MINRENIPAPSVEELKAIFSTKGSESESVADGLVYTALGFYDDDDYLGLAKIVTDHGGVDELARAEARFKFIEEYDERGAEYEGYSAEAELKKRRLAGVDYIVSKLSQKESDRFFDMMTAEEAWLENEQIEADLDLPYA